MAPFGKSVKAKEIRETRSNCGSANAQASNHGHTQVQGATVRELGFCAWASDIAGFPVSLPTEAQWEFASRGGLDDQVYPWGNVFDDANLWCSVSTKRGMTGSVVRTSTTFRNGYGLTDMSGNVWEWCADWYSDKYVIRMRTRKVAKTRMVRASGVSGLLGRMIEEHYEDEVVGAMDVENPVGSETGQYRCVRGGSGLSSPGFFRCADRGRYFPGNWYIYIGFRLSAGLV